MGQSDQSRLREKVDASKRQCGFHRGNSMIQPSFCLRISKEKHGELENELRVVFVDLENHVGYSTNGTNLVLPTTKTVSNALMKTISDMTVRVARQRHNQCGWETQHDYKLKWDLVHCCS